MTKQVQYKWTDETNWRGSYVLPDAAADKLVQERNADGGQVPGKQVFIQWRAVPHGA